jgi:YfiH family protein
MEAFLDNIGMKEPAVCMKQVHSGTVAVVTDKKQTRIIDVDALLTQKNQVPLAVLTADCIPLLVYDPKKHIIGVIHAGYKGLYRHIIENTLDQMITTFQTDAKDVIIGIGPCIETKCFEVGEEVIALFRETFPDFNDMYETSDGKYYLNMRNIAQQCLQQKGVIPEHIEIMDVCTKCSDDFYSYRGGDINNRFASVVALK